MSISPVVLSRSDGLDDEESGGKYDGSLFNATISKMTGPVGTMLFPVTAKAPQPLRQYRINHALPELGKVLDGPWAGPLVQSC